MKADYKKWRKAVIKLIGLDCYYERDYLEWYNTGKSPEYVKSFLFTES